MPALDIQDLAEQFRVTAAGNALTITPNSEGMITFSGSIDGLDFTVTHDPSQDSENVLVLIVFGAVPEDREVLVLRELLHANLLMLQDRAPAFSRSPLTGNIFLQYACPLAKISGKSLWDAMRSFIQPLAKWRHDYSLDLSPAAAVSALHRARDEAA